MNHGFTRLDWKSINTIDAEGRIISKMLEPVDYFARDGTHYRISSYQTTDYASAPGAVWGPPLFLIPYGWWSLPAVLHDAGFQNQLLVVNGDGSTRLAFPGQDTESAINLLFLEAMQSVLPNPTMFQKLQMDAIFSGVTIGGWHAFKEDRT